MMKDYKTIVVPVDGSENSKRAIEHAVTLASTVGAALLLVYVANIVSVISNFDQIPNASGYVTEQVALDMEEEGRRFWPNWPRIFPTRLRLKKLLKWVHPGRPSCPLPRKTMPISSSWAAAASDRLRGFYGLCQQLRRNPRRLPRYDCQINRSCKSCNQAFLITAFCVFDTYASGED